MTDDRQRAPLLAWGLAIGLALPMAAPVFVPSMASWSIDAKTLRQAHYRHELTEFLRAPLEERANARGVMLTMSGGSCATVGPLQLAPGGVEMYVVNYAAAIPEDFADAVEVIFGSVSQPEFVVVQDTVILHHSRSRTYDAYLRARQNWRDLFFGLVPWTEDDTRDNVLKAESERRCTQRAIPVASWAETLEKAISEIQPYSDNQARYIDNLLARFFAAGIPVLIVSPPHNEYSAQYRILVFQTARAFAQRRSGQSALPGVSWHRQPLPIPAFQFMDSMHVSPAATNAYRGWLNGEIEQVLGIRGD